MEQKIIKTKQAFHWHFADMYLDLLLHMQPIREDKVFCEKLYDLKNYIDKNLSLDGNGDIIETYVTVLQQSEE